MINDLNEVIERIKTFNDSEYLAKELTMLAEQFDESVDIAYMLKESADNLSGMFGLIMQLKKHLIMSQRGDADSRQ